MQTPPVAVWWSLACLAGVGLLIWCLRVEPAATRKRRGDVPSWGRDILALLLIAAAVLLASPSTVKLELVQWMARKSKQASLNKAMTLAQRQARDELLALEQRVAPLTQPSAGEGGHAVTALSPRRDDPFPWRDMTEAEAEALNRSSVEGFDKELDYRRMFSEQTSAAKHHCQYRLWRADGGAESKPVAVFTLLPDDHLGQLNRTRAYQGWSLANDGTRLTVNLMGGQIANGDHRVFALVLGQFLMTNPPTRVSSQDLSGRHHGPPGNGSTQSDTVVMALKSVQRGSNALIRHTTNFSSAPELVGRLRCTDAPPGQLAVLLDWLHADSKK